MSGSRTSGAGSTIGADWIGHEFKKLGEKYDLSYAISFSYLGRPVPLTILLIDRSVCLEKTAHFDWLFNTAALL